MALKTKFINEPASKDVRRALRIAGYEHLKRRQYEYESEHNSLEGRQTTFVHPHTYQGQTESYLNLVLRPGEPREEIRFYHSIGSRQAYRILFVYIDYTVGVTFDVTGEEWTNQLFDWFHKSGKLEQLRIKS